MFPLQNEKAIFNRGQCSHLIYLMTAWDQRKIVPSHAKAVKAISYVNEPRDSEEGVELLMPNRWSCESKKNFHRQRVGVMKSEGGLPREGRERR
ncbi:hypothetical protein TNCV_2581961 [Trichonephila clavipes]|nr:hypothetical protein TNCV_2581961 [Trichonephila clavipes]